MKERFSFVSNSSSASYIIYTNLSREKFLKEITSEFWQLKPEEVANETTWLKYGAHLVDGRAGVEIHGGTIMHNDFGDMPEILHHVVCFLMFVHPTAIVACHWGWDDHQDHR